MTDFIAAISAGITQTMIGHPFDTIKVLLQNNNKIRGLHFKDYYRGYRYPLTSSILLNSIIFPVYERTKYLNNSFLSGLIGGMTISPIVYLFDYGKVNKQVEKDIKFQEIIKGKGKFTVFLRESTAYSIYFGVYNYLKQNYNLHPLISGALCGVANWLITYPIDVIKNRQIAQQINIIDAINQGKLYNGLSICLIRAIIVNASIFSTYETIKQLIE